MRVGGEWLVRSETQAVLQLLGGAGYRALVVGGCVRNALLGHDVSDIDVATDAHPDHVVALAEAAGVKSVPTGIEHGTVTLVLGGRPYEVTTFRRDIETDGRRAVVAFSNDVAEDAARRDLTMNALYAEADGTVIDPLDGLPDLLARRVRFVGDPARRIAEDRLRVLRFFRFHAWYGDPQAGLDPEGLAACADAVGALGALSRERVGAEMIKLLAAPDPAPAASAMEQAGVLTAILPGAAAACLGPLVAAEERVGAPAHPLRRLAAIGGEDPARRLRLSKADARRVALLRTVDGGIAELAWRHGPNTASDIALVRVASGSDLPADLEERIALGAGAEFPLSASDLPFEGAALGRALAEAEKRWIASDFRLTRDDLLSGTN